MIKGTSRNGKDTTGDIPLHIFDELEKVEIERLGDTHGQRESNLFNDFIDNTVDERRDRIMQDMETSTSNGEEATDEEDYVSEDEDYELALSEAQRHWEESLQQLNKALNWVILPLLGKFMGRKAATFVWKRVAGWFW
ncbi:hypothetical protein KAFR_0B02840 [Kazachstania africana CBS 2517]|uniref:Uncharacterized protein n=1 Tax=Kazachstania africana (strain ATCC 22294 / BCRC 22015 / CBS 2517 / CECT 1963 / NBRC 1671 / NRRL Y-8276) TaxID=1071382 RepID=H2AQD1_KAZAF|nr:hypothetical protein KAFR_0B02840 [Kazachstania africana CBS 2517]CCF56581.1 hypothetical protein KAFR_0B02840 [Kazachstania africana CBS 2517]